MRNHPVIGTFITPILLIILVLGGFWFVVDKRKTSEDIQFYKEELAKLTVKNAENEAILSKISKQVEGEETKKETKNGGMIEAANGLFSAVYEYHSDREADSVKTRKEKASEFANQQALNGLFPKDADQITSSVTTVSRLEKNPVIYLMLSEREEVKALVIVEYSVTIAGSNPQSGTFMYKVTFDPVANQFTAIQNVGDIHVP